MSKVIIGAVGVLAVVVAIYFYGQRQYNAGINECNRQHNEAALEAFKAESEKLTGLSIALDERITELANIKPKIIERYHETTTKIPLPADCIIDSDRLQHINEAIRASNATR